MPTAFKSGSLRPLTGPMDVRSLPGDMLPGSFRWKENFSVTENGSLCRTPGWRRLFHSRTANNFDLHDQLLAIQLYYDENSPPTDGADDNSTYPPGAFCSGSYLFRYGVREPITMLYESTSTSGTRKLFAGTQSRIYQLNEADGNWSIITDGMGSAGTRFHAAQLGDTILFTNGYDAPFAHVLGQPPQGCAIRRIQAIQDLADMGITQAGIVLSYNGLMLLMDVTQEGTRYTSRIRWSDLNNPLSWKGSNDSLANFQDLDYGERIVAAKELGNYLVIYTTRSIWRAQVQGNTSNVFGFQKVYSEKKNQDKCLVYPNTLVSTGASHFYMGRDGIYEYNQYIPEPDRVEWLHRGSGVLYDNLDPNCCEWPVGEFYPNQGEVWFSVPQNGTNCFPSRTLVCSVKHKTTGYVNYGFTAFGNFRSDNQPSLRSWLKEFCVCTEAELAAQGFGYIKEGLPTCGNESVEPECTQPYEPTCLYTDQSITINGVTMEDPDGPPSATSLCNLLSGTSLTAGCNPCNEEQTFIGASATDYCLKQIGASYNREVCTNVLGDGTVNFPEGQLPTYSAFCGEYRLDGYDSVLRGTFPLGTLPVDKVIKHLTVQFEAQYQASPCQLTVRIGDSYRPVDLNVENCGAVWSALSPKKLACPNSQSPTAYGYNNLRPHLGTEWECYQQGRYLHFELRIGARDGSLAKGGASCFSSLDFVVAMNSA